MTELQLNGGRVATTCWGKGCVATGGACCNNLLGKGTCCNGQANEGERDVLQQANKGHDMLQQDGREGCVATCSIAMFAS